MSHLPGAGVELDFKRDTCPRHIEPFRADYPKGVAVFMLLMFDSFAHDERVLAMAPHDEEGLAESAALPRLVLECAPLCCFIGDEEVTAITREALSGEPGPRLEAIRRRYSG